MARSCPLATPMARMLHSSSSWQSPSARDVDSARPTRRHPAGSTAKRLAGVLGPACGARGIRAEPPRACRPLPSAHGRRLRCPARRRTHRPHPRGLLARGSPSRARAGAVGDGGARAAPADGPARCILAGLPTTGLDRCPDGRGRGRGWSARRAPSRDMPRSVERWAHSVWDAWADQQDLVRGLTARLLGEEPARPHPRRALRSAAGP